MRASLVSMFLLSWLAGFSQAYDSLPNEPEHYKARLAKFNAEAATQGRILFLGNSITEGGNWRALLKDSTVVNRGISGDNSFGVLRRLDEVVRHKPSKIFLLIGVNDLSKSIPQATILQNIFSIIGHIHAGSPRTEIYVQGILPVNPAHKKFPARFAHQAVAEVVNGQLKKYDKALKYTYVDTFSQFLNSDRTLDLKYSTDGLHLNKAGYEHWIAYLKMQQYL